MIVELRVGDVLVDVVFKDIKNVHLSVHPPTGRVRLAAPERMNFEAIRLFAISKIGWIRKNQRKIEGQARETPREFIERESHFLWGQRYLLRIVDGEDRDRVAVSGNAIELRARDAESLAIRERLLSEFYREELRAKARSFIASREKQLGVTVDRLFIQKMRTKWGSSSPERRTVRLNLELAKFPPGCLDYIVIHEMAHFIVRNHGPQFTGILDYYMPGWRTVRDHLNEGPLPPYQ